MGLISPQQISDGTTIDAADVNTPINTIANEVNGSLDANNLADDAVTTAKIADDAVTDAKRPRLLSARATTATTNSLSNATFETVPFETEDYDPEGWHDTSTNNDRVTVDEAGLYLVVATVSMAGSASGDLRAVRIKKNSTVIANEYRPQAFDGSYAITISISAVIDAAASDYFVVDAYQNTGGALDFGHIGGGNTSWLTVTKLSD